MKTTTDRMGGIISAKIIAVQDILAGTSKNGRCTIILKDGKEYTILDMEKNGAEASVTPTTLRSGNLFDINITIELKNAVEEKYTSFNKYLCVLETPTHESYVFGTPDFPLMVVPESMFAKLPSGRTGKILKLTGKQPHNVLILS